MLRIFKRLWQTNWASQWQYRANSMMYVLYWLVSPVVYLAVWSTVANSQGSVNGLTANDFITYYLTLLLIDTFTSEITIYVLGYKIQDGSLSGELLLPVHPILTTNLVNNLAFKALTLIVMLPAWLVLTLLIRPDFSEVTLNSVLLTIPAVLLGFGINFLLGSALTCIAFWTTKVYSIIELYYGLSILFAGQFVPLDLLPPAIQQVARFLPFQLQKYFPIQLALNRLSPELIVQGYAMAIFWFVVSFLIFSWVWKAGLRRYSAVGA